MKTRIGLVAAVILLYAIASYAQALSSDKGSQEIKNHSVGVIVFDGNKLDGQKAAGTYAPAVNLYTSMAIYPTTFRPVVATFDGGCNKIPLEERPLITGLSGITSATQPVYCDFEMPYSILDAGIFTVFRNLDGGFAVSQCPAVATINQTAFPAFCHIQKNRLP